jgi:transposase-like protein
MRAKFNQAFKLQTVEKALNRGEGISLAEMAKFLGVGQSTLSKWIFKSRVQTLVRDSNQPISTVNGMAFEKRPQDWSGKEKLAMVIRCGSISDVEINQICREQGIYAHHIKQWQDELGSGDMTSKLDNKAVENRRLKSENKALKKELHRKEKALAEAAALLILQKKANHLWGYDEDDSQ